ncbi:MAG: GNAT family N-acetyltransferase [Chloroflexota bacterium]
MAETKPETLSNIQNMHLSSPITMIPAIEFSLEALTDIYNRTRVDYVVPMPMSKTKMQEYIHNYDVDLEKSVVAMDMDTPLGLAMLGVRGGHTWVTRLGVIPDGRKGGVGRQMMERLIDNSISFDAKAIILEVIKNNAPAQKLFERLGFRPIRDLHIIRRPPTPVNMSIKNDIYIEKLGYQEAISLLPERTDVASWVTDNASLFNAGHLSALKADIPELGGGWLVYQNTVFQLGRLVIKTDSTATAQVASDLLNHLHWLHPVQDTIVENIAIDDQHWHVYKDLGYLVSFSRIEMKLDLTTA